MPKKLFLPLAVLLGASALISGCGQKGPLYLPQGPAAPAQPQPAATPVGTAPATAEPVYTEPTQAPVQTDEQQRREPATEQSEVPEEPVIEK
ncbi:LPS translocon maturation chaperone LptM [Microbulbifer marinus]|uniref:Lipoprotein-attachment site-containing protein n=1 Tax=Microbulbifer marinus TaxID=658218 RepID=A0A1H3ZCX9_9GAMM|nr:lipoprotein [Microbulbifer marinus]SEA21500.1 lipoprotein-attachment site-containing protein [Microbulbifer marinus]